MKQTVYLAYASIDYEGVYEPSMRVFSTEEGAQRYVEKLDRERVCDRRTVKALVVDSEESGKGD